MLAMILLTNKIYSARYFIITEVKNNTKYYYIIFYRNKEDKER